ncbi:ABC transporter ATP-binding protein [Bradyrhizobium sp. U87765 SZCCT0131]|uniref:ABC transporter ATP-binding protein n=1 Tax=unclassified Bradyrhizobium TaxID=2631580 RepID=UPI001BA95980|nr:MULTISPECIES: ABC transporter ATP-binding protein [unclassified Bradyrhizobium]MBR1222409.1 ABC transporter ATP-binding protein [Bradyrhizobium sp. U87765 SZCCT0131]MBR1264107.1 ABC transporter ATP-binding protein [Bradyrhizobium sp. U87765 SZCCT0134]MBR1308110.1 ABC transporter ATP-binding protein [Bradyrhizobium sp. U87765 SZCCT0110]MBR1320357.1 ABC transporter ATP-binding protein [Bradyrhizobium sp. U87765 SZCCT0109]MBR1348530.1 ABC transporter ATP-binding protein [Bradyrhizobium sp. U87
MTQPILAVDGVGRTFGGFVALEGVTTAFMPGKVTSIIGPNGAGKSTFFNILSGALAPSRGSIHFKGRNLTGTKQHAFVHLGIARSYQITSIFPELSVHENVRVAAQAGRSRYNIWTHRDRLRDLAEKADAALDAVGLSGKRAEAARLLAHGQQRSLEIAIALVSDPEVLLLDEPTAGMGPEETKEMVALLEKLAAERTILLVEHKMKMILGLSDRILVLHHGRLIADGTPRDIQTDAEVRRVYLGQNDGYA